MSSGLILDMRAGVFEEGDILPAAGDSPCVELNRRSWTFAQSVAT
jgi:hypothetical protein